MRFRCPACHRQYRLARRRSLSDTPVRPHCLWCRAELRLARVVGLPGHELLSTPEKSAARAPSLWSRWRLAHNHDLQDVATLVPAVRRKRRSRMRLLVGIALFAMVLLPGYLPHRAHLGPGQPVQVARAVTTPPQPEPETPALAWLDIQPFALDLAAAVEPPVPRPMAAQRAEPTPVPAQVAKVRARKRQHSWSFPGQEAGKTWPVAGPSAPLLPMSPTGTDE